MMMDKNVDRPFLSEEETRQKLNKLLFPLPPPRGVENTGLSKRKMSISLSLSLNFQLLWIRAKTKNFYRIISSNFTNLLRSAAKQ